MQEVGDSPTTTSTGYIILILPWIRDFKLFAILAESPAEFCCDLYRAALIMKCCQGLSTFVRRIGTDPSGRIDQSADIDRLASISICLI